MEREIVERHVKPGGRLLDIGCGAGREALGLARIGFGVVGIGIAPRMIEAARLNAERKGLAITFTVQSVSDPREPCFFHDFSGPEEVRAELEGAGLSAEEVAPGGWVCRHSLLDSSAGVA